MSRIIIRLAAIAVICLAIPTASWAYKIVCNTYLVVECGDGSQHGCYDVHGSQHDCDPAGSLAYDEVCEDHGGVIGVVTGDGVHVAEYLGHFKLQPADVDGDPTHQAHAQLAATCLDGTIQICDDSFICAKQASEPELMCMNQGGLLFAEYVVSMVALQSR